MADRGTTPRRTRHAFVVLPAIWMTEPLAGAEDASDVVARALRAHGHHEVRSTASPRGDMEACPPADTTCARSVARQLGADRAMTVQLAKLGHTVVVKVALLDVDDGSGEQTRQEIVQAADPGKIARALTDISLELAPPARQPVEDDAPLYTHWAFITGAAAVIAAASITAIVLLADDGDGNDDPDVTIRPPAP